MNDTHLLATYRDVVARLHNEATVPTADAASDFLDIAQSVEHQELAPSPRRGWPSGPSVCKSR